MSVKKWVPGVADEPRKAIIAAREYSRAKDVLPMLTYILTDCGGNDEAGIAHLRAMSGQEIVDGIEAYRDAMFQSFAAGYSRG